MEAAIRWSPNSNPDDQRFLIADVAGNRLRHCRVRSINRQKVEYTVLARKEKIHNYTAFDWHRGDEGLVATGDGLGVTRIIRLETEDDEPSATYSHEFRIRQERKCNSIAFSKKNLLASAYDRTRTDASLNIYDLNQSSPSEPITRLANADSVTNVKFFTKEADLLLAGTAQPKQGAFLRLFDLREPSNTAAAAFVTKNCHLLSIDPLDENYFASAGPSGEPVISIWDRRALKQSNAPPLTAMASQSSVLEIRPAIDLASDGKIWSLRYSGYRRGCFGILSSTGQMRCFETMRYPPNPGTDTEPEEGHETWFGGTYFVKRSHELQGPWSSNSKSTETRPIAFDFAGPGCFGPDACIISIRHNKNLEIRDVPFTTPKMALTAKHHFTLHDEDDAMTQTPNRRGTIAEDLMEIQDRYSAQPGDDSGEQFQAAGRSQFDQSIAPQSSLERHQNRLSVYRTEAKLSLEDILTVQDAQRRRCKEGYLFDCEKNKEIVKNDPWLVEMWDIIKRMEDMAMNAGMIHESFDLSYLGVHNIWNAKLGPHPSRLSKSFSRPSKPSPRPEFTNALHYILYHHGYPAFSGVETSYPLHRQLSLAICGWRFSEARLRKKCNDIVSRGEHYKAIVVAFCHGRKDVAIELLRNASREGKISNSGLAVVIAGDPLNSEQRVLCEWMADEATNPYLKAMLTWYMTGSWNSVIEMRGLPLVYRVALALKYLDDDELSTFVETETQLAIDSGDIEGIILTGLAEPAMDLFQAWIAKTSDLQTAILATAFTVPRYVEEARWEIWRESYFEQLQSWRCHKERVHFGLVHQKKLSTNPRTGANMARPDIDQPQIRCNHCQANIARQPFKEHDLNDTASFTSRLSRNLTPAANAGTVCRRCGRPMPRCALCMLWLGSPDPFKWHKTEAEKREDKFARMAIFCAKCGHGCHAHEAKLWWKDHIICPVTECNCSCGVR